MPKTAIQCTFPSAGTYGLFYIYMGLPGVALLLATFALLWHWTLGCRPLKMFRLSKAKKEKVRAKLVTRNRTVWQVLIVCVCLCLCRFDLVPRWRGVRTCDGVAEGGRACE